MLERYAMKVARTVLRGGSDSNATPLPDQQLSCLSRQLFFIWLQKRKNYIRKGCWSRCMALRMVRNLRMQAVSATFFSLPRFNNCWY